MVLQSLVRGCDCDCLMAFGLNLVVSVAYPVDVKPEPPVSGLVLPKEKDPVLPSSSSSPGEESDAHGDAAPVHDTHQQDVNTRILTALIVSATLLGIIILLETCFWFYNRMKKLKSLDPEKGQKQNSVTAKKVPAGPIFEKVTPLKAPFKAPLLVTPLK